MEEDRFTEQTVILSRVGDALLDEGAGYSVGKLVADLEGDGIEEDPYNVRDRHFLQDLQQRESMWRDEPRDIEEVDELIDTLSEYWVEYPERRFCQIVCNAHQITHGLGDFDPDDDSSPYEEPLTELSDEQLTGYLERRLAREE